MLDMHQREVPGRRELYVYSKRQIPLFFVCLSAPDRSDLLHTYAPTTFPLAKDNEIVPEKSWPIIDIISVPPLPIGRPAAGAFTSLTIAFVTSALTKVVLRMSRGLRVILVTRIYSLIALEYTLDRQDE